MAITGQTLTDGLCSPVGGLSAIDSFISAQNNRERLGAIVQVANVANTAINFASELGDGAWVDATSKLKGPLALASIANDLVSLGDDIEKYGKVQPSTAATLGADILIGLGMVITPIGVPLAIVGALLTAYAFGQGRKEKADRERFAKFASYLNSNQAQEYMKCPKCLNIEISSPTVYENDGIATFTIKLDKPLEEELKLRVFTIQGTATENVDYKGLNWVKPIEVIIPPHTKEFTKSIEIVRDGKTENKENFLLVAKYYEYSYKGEDVKNITKIASGLATIIDIEQDKCPKPVTPNFSLNFPLPSSPSYYTPTYGGGGSSGGSSGGGGSSGSTYTPTITPLPNVPYIPCYDTPEKHSALVMKVNTSANSNENSDNATYETREANNLNSNPTRHSEQSEESLNFNSNNANSIDTENSENSNNETTTQPNKIYFDYNNDGFKENMLTWFSKDEAVLVNDINNNGIVDNGSEILGSNYTDKFGNKVIDILSLLDEFDTNNDGIINNKDNTNLALWQDKNQNGKTDENELIKFANLNLLVA